MKKNIGHEKILAHALTFTYFAGNQVFNVMRDPDINDLIVLKSRLLNKPNKQPKKQRSQVKLTHKRLKRPYIRLKPGPNSKAFGRLT